MTQPSDNPASARVTLVPNPIASPGQCGICGNNKHPIGFADARLDFEFYGTFYLCGYCVGDYARLFGYLAPEDYASLKNTLAEQASELVVLRSAVLQLEAAVDALSNYKSLVTDGPLSRDDADLFSVVEDAPVSSSAPDEATEGPSVTEQQPAKSGAGERSVVVSVTTGDGDTAAIGL